MSVTIYAENNNDFVVFMNTLNGLSDKAQVLKEIRFYLAVHPINPSSARLSRITLSDSISTMISEVEGYIDSRKESDDYGSYENNNPYWVNEDISDVERLQEAIDTYDCYTNPYEVFMNTVAKYLVVIKYNDLMIHLRDALACESDPRGFVKAYVDSRLRQLKDERRNEMVTRGSFTFEDCIDSRIAIIARPITVDDALALKHDVLANLYMPYKIAYIREWIANHAIKHPIEMIGGVTYELAAGDNSDLDRSERIDQAVKDFVDSVTRGDDYSLCNSMAEDGETLLFLAKDLVAYGDGTHTISPEWMQCRAARYLTNVYTDKTMFWLRAALLVPAAGCGQYIQKYIEDRRFDFPNYQSEIEEVLGLERRSEMTNDVNVNGVVDTQVEPKVDEPTNNEVFTCSWCGEVHSADELHNVNNGEMICDSCFNDSVVCEDCGTRVAYSDSHCIDVSRRGERTICENCMDNYRRCNSCGEWVDRESGDAYYSECEGEWYCESCYDDRFTTCDCCGCELYRDDVYEYDGEYYCESCYDEKSCNSVICDYHDYDADDYYTLYAKDEERGNQVTFGVELEVAGSTSYAEGLLDIMNGGRTQTVHLEYDSTVDGFEIITEPMTRQFFEEEFKPLLEKGLAYLRNHGFRGHGKGGMHIHFTKISNRAQLMRMIRVLYGDMTAVELWEQISQRGVDNMNWCRLMNYRSHRTEEILKGDYMVATGRGDDHNNGLNYDPHRTDTHELRIFNSTIRFDRFVKNMEVLFSLLDYTSMGGNSIRVDAFTYLDYVRAHRDDYPALHNFLTEKELWTFGQVIPDELYMEDTCDVMNAFPLPRQLPIDDSLVIPDIQYDKIPDISEEDMKLWSAEIDKALAEI